MKRGGIENFRFKPRDMDVEPYFTFEVAFGEPEIVKDHPVVSTLQYFANAVEEIIEPFRPLLI